MSRSRKEVLLSPSLRAAWSTSNPSPAKPWMSPEVMKLLEGVLQATKASNMLEFGCGGSMRYFSRFIEQYYSIESNADFYTDVIQGLPGNVELVLREQGDSSEEDRNEFHSHPLFHLMNDTMSSKPRLHTSRWDGFERYILQASRFDVHKFDLILIDGVARAAAAFYVLDLITEHSRVAIHDFWTDSMQNWNPCNLLKYYRVDAAAHQQMPYVSGSSVIVLQKRKKRGRALSRRSSGCCVAFTCTMLVLSQDSERLQSDE